MGLPQSCAMCDTSLWSLVEKKLVSPESLAKHYVLNNFRFRDDAISLLGGDHRKESLGVMKQFKRWFHPSSTMSSSNKSVVEVENGPVIFQPK